ncbi:MAG: hypothetical protein K2I59_06530, partial [Alistipes sp.]|nr:hypothetical protein [Alistipes sp.]
TLAWVERNVAHRERTLAARHPEMAAPLREFGEQLRKRGLTPETAYLFMHGHTLMDNVVMVLLNTVCEKLRDLSVAKINSSKKQGVALRNEMSNYTNSLRSVRDVLLDNENYTRCPLYKRLQRDITRYIVRTILEMKRRGEIRGDSYLTVLHRLREGLK